MGESSHGLTVDEALDKIEEASEITDAIERGKAFRKILMDVRSLAYHDGSEEERCQGSWWL